MSHSLGRSSDLHSAQTSKGRLGNVLERKIFSGCPEDFLTSLRSPYCMDLSSGLLDCPGGCI